MFTTFILGLLLFLPDLIYNVGNPTGSQPYKIPILSCDTISISLFEGEKKTFSIRVNNLYPCVSNWQIVADSIPQWLSFSATRGRLNPGEKSEIKLIVEGKVCGDFTFNIITKYNNTSIINRLRKLRISVRQFHPPRTIFLISSSRLKKFYPDSSDLLISALKRFINHFEVRGIILDVDSSSEVKKAYQIWDEGDNWQSPSIANRVAIAIDNLLEDFLKIYPTIKYIILIGDDIIIPYYRIKDKSSINFQEINYTAHKPNFTTGAAVDSNVILTNDLYADLEEEFNPSYLSIPYEYIVSRLVRSPTQIISQLATFTSEGSEIPVFDIFVSSGDYIDSTATFDLKDVADSIVQIYGSHFGFGQIDNRLIQKKEIYPDYDFKIFSSLFLRHKFDLYSINNHAYHYGFFMPQHTMLKVKEMAQEPKSFHRAIIHTVGCHTGMSDNRLDQSLQDFPGLFAQKGVGAYIANTAYSIGSGLGINYSERLQMLIALQLAQGKTVGEALFQAKEIYWAGHNPSYSNPFDDVKVILPVSLFGLPYYRCVAYDYRFDVASK